MKKWMIIQIKKKGVKVWMLKSKIRIWKREEWCDLGKEEKEEEW